MKASSPVIRVQEKGVTGMETMKKNLAIWTLLVLLLAGTDAFSSEKNLAIEGRKLTSPRPPFTLVLPSEFRLADSFSQEIPAENSLTRAYLLVKAKDQRLEELFILQIADRTNPQASPMALSPLKPYTEKRLYLKEIRRIGDLSGEYLTQLMAWNPEAPSLKGISKKGVLVPSHWALQGQFQFLYVGEHAVSIRYSKDVGSFGLQVSDDGKRWEKDSLKGNEKRASEIFNKTFMEIVDSLQVKSP
jgi:hypothetical protein